MRKQPSSLFEICVKNSVDNIISACDVIHKRFPLFLDKETNECRREILHLRSYVTSIVPGRIFDVICSKRDDILAADYYGRYGDLYVFTCVMLHPHMTVLRQHPLRNEDFYARMRTRQFWIENLPKLTHLVVINLPRICTDEILRIISENCPLLEELIAFSTRDNHDVYVSNKGLYYLTKLKRLRIFQLDYWYDDEVNTVKRVTRNGIIALIKELPNLEELKIPNAARIIIKSPGDIGPLALKTITVQYPEIEEFIKFSIMCPLLKELTLNMQHCNFRNKTIRMIRDSINKLELRKLNLEEINTSEAFQILKYKGSYLTHLYLYTSIVDDIHIYFDSVVQIGKFCPHLQKLCIECRKLVVPEEEDYQEKNNIFSKLKTLELGYGNFCIKSIVSFFAECSNDLQSLFINIKSVNDLLDVDEELTFLLNNGHLDNIEELWFSEYLKLSKNLIINIINKCEKLRTFAYGTDFKEDADIIDVEVDSFIKNNNLDINIMKSNFYNDRFSPQLKLTFVENYLLL